MLKRLKSLKLSDAARKLVAVAVKLTWSLLLIHIGIGIGLGIALAMQLYINQADIIMPGPVSWGWL